MIATETADGVSRTVSLKLLRGNVLQDKQTSLMEENDLSKDTEEKSVVLTTKQVSGQKIEIGKCAANVTLVEGESETKVKSEKLTSLSGKVIEYSTNSDGLITKITVYNGEQRQRKYNDEFKTFTDATYDGAFMINDKTVFFVIPSTAQVDTDYEVKYSIVDTAYYMIAPYNMQTTFDSDFEIASICVISSSVNGHRPGIISANTPISIVTKVTRAINEEGIDTTKIYAYTSGVICEYLMRIPYGNEIVPAAPMVGDIAKFSIDGDSNIDDYMMIMNAGDTSMPLFRIGARTNNERFYGLVYNKRQDILQGLNGRVVKQIDVSYHDDYSELITLDISALLEKQMYLYERDRDRVALATYDDIFTEVTNGSQASRVVLHIVAGEIRGIVIIK